MDSNSYDVVVVGNGVLGLSLATALTLRSAGKIAVVGDETRAFAATPAAGAMLGCFGEPMDVDKVAWLDPDPSITGSPPSSVIYTPPPAEFLSALNFSDEADRQQMRSY